MKSNTRREINRRLRYTVRDVAQEAGVSIATVSRVLNTPDSVSIKTQDKVHEAIKRLNYARNQVASSLRSSSSAMVGFVVSDITNPFFVRVIKSAERVLRSHDYTMLICDSEEDPAKEYNYLNDLFARQIDGLIIIPSIEHNKIPQILKSRDVPTVFVDRYLSDRFDCIMSNNQAGISLLVSHLASKGYHKIGLVCGSLDTLTGRQRYEAFTKMLKLYNLPFDHNWTRFCDFSVEGGYKATRELIASKSIPEALIASNNLTGIGALRAIHDSNLEIPRDIGLVVFDEVILGDVTNPPLTVVEQPSDLIGAEAARLLVNRMYGNTSLPPQIVVYDPKLIVRGSTRAISNESVITDTKKN